MKRRRMRPLEMKRTRMMMKMMMMTKLPEEEFSGEVLRLS
jgi:hypothetical protein